MGISLRLIVILAFCLACTVVLSQDADLGELVEQPLGLTPALDPDLVHEFRFRLGKGGRRPVRRSRRNRRKRRKAHKEAGGENAEEEKAGGENGEEEKAGGENGEEEKAGGENGGGQAAGADRNGGCATLFNTEAMFCCPNPRKCYRGENALATCKKNCIG